MPAPPASPAGLRALGIAPDHPVEANIVFATCRATCAAPRLGPVPSTISGMPGSTARPEPLQSPPGLQLGDDRAEIDHFLALLRPLTVRAMPLRKIAIR